MYNLMGITFNFYTLSNILTSVFSNLKWDICLDEPTKGRCSTHQNDANNISVFCGKNTPQDFMLSLEFKVFDVTSRFAFFPWCWWMLLMVKLAIHPCMFWHLFWHGVRLSSTHLFMLSKTDNTNRHLPRLLFWKMFSKNSFFHLAFIILDIVLQTFLGWSIRQQKSQQRIQNLSFQNLFVGHVTLSLSFRQGSWGSFWVCGWLNLKKLIFQIRMKRGSRICPTVVQDISSSCVGLQKTILENNHNSQVQMEDETNESKNFESVKSSPMC